MGAIRRKMVFLPKKLAMFLHERENWWQFRYDTERILCPLAAVRARIGTLCGRMAALGFEIQNETLLDALSVEIRKSSEIEGELLDLQQIRSSIASKLGIDTSGVVASTHYIEGVVEMMLDALQNYRMPLSDERLFGWHSVLFPSGRSGLYKIEVGQYRTGEMQVVSGPMGQEKVHYKAPLPQRVEPEMERFIRWVNDTNDVEPIVKAAIAHLWFLTIHPFDDGNGRIARAITDMLLARTDGSSKRFYSMSRAILNNRKGYYAVLEHTQHGAGDITDWLLWFISALDDALTHTDETLASVFAKADFWKAHDSRSFNARQYKMLNRLMDGIEGKMNTSKWAKMCKCSSDTALNDINDLIQRGIMRKNDAGGKNTNYELV